MSRHTCWWITKIWRSLLPLSSAYNSFLIEGYDLITQTFCIMRAWEILPTLRVDCQIHQTRKVFCQILQYLSVRLSVHLLTHRVFICLSVCLLCVSEPNEGSGREQKMFFFRCRKGKPDTCVGFVVTCLGPTAVSFITPSWSPKTRKSKCELWQSLINCLAKSVIIIIIIIIVINIISSQYSV
jgi:hypothetical protein